MRCVYCIVVLKLCLVMIDAVPDGVVEDLLNSFCFGSIGRGGFECFVALIVIVCPHN